MNAFSMAQDNTMCGMWDLNPNLLVKNNRVESESCGPFVSTKPKEEGK